MICFNAGIFCTLWSKKCHAIIFKPHRCVSWLQWPIAIQWLAWSVSLSVGHVPEPCSNSWTDRDAVWDADWGGPKEPWIRLECGKEHFWEGVCSIWKHCSSQLCNNGWTLMVVQYTDWISERCWPRQHTGIVLSEIDICMYEKSAI